MFGVVSSTDLDPEIQTPPEPKIIKWDPPINVWVYFFLFEPRGPRRSVHPNIDGRIPLNDFRRGWQNESWNIV